MARFFIYSVVFFLGWCLHAEAQKPDSVLPPSPRVITLDQGPTNYMRILGGPPETSTMRSGLVQLAPGASVGAHNTEKYEEMLIVLNGSGEMIITGGSRLPIGKGKVAYCPPHTGHDVLNTGSDTLRYIYVVAEAKAQRKTK